MSLPSGIIFNIEDIANAPLLTQHQKLTVAIIAVIGITTIIFGILSIRKAIVVLPPPTLPGTRCAAFKG